VHHEKGSEKESHARLVDFGRRDDFVGSHHRAHGTTFYDSIKSSSRGINEIEATVEHTTHGGKRTMMDQKAMFKQMVDFNKAALDNTFSAMATVQDQTEKMAKTVLEQATWLPEEGKKVISEWIQAHKKGRDDYKKLVDDNFKKVEDFFAASK
jgi:polyhydroxyalkanoate synthesis regulator phasin